MSKTTKKKKIVDSEVINDEKTVKCGSIKVDKASKKTKENIELQKKILNLMTEYVTEGKSKTIPYKEYMFESLDHHFKSTVLAYVKTVIDNEVKEAIGDILEKGMDQLLKKMKVKDVKSDEEHIKEMN